jgi:hypothetical protein
MSLSDKYRKKREEIATERERLAVERAKDSVKRIMESEQFRLSSIALPEADMAVDAIIKDTVRTTLDPVGQLLDTLRAKGFRPAEIRKMVHRLYITYIQSLNTPEDQTPGYDEMLSSVADYVYTHQELYNTLDPESLRGD